MIERLLGIRREDRRDVAVGFTTLLLVMVGHGMLEAARDTLFLQTLAPSLLPWAYLAMAALAVVASRFNTVLLQRFSHARVLSLTLVFGAVGTACFWVFSSLKGSAGSLVAFYVWTGLLATGFAVQFWLQLSEVVDIAQAKRVFSWIGAGGLLGAALGSIAASVIVSVADARALPIVAAALFLAASFLPAFFTKKSRSPSSVRGRRAAPEAKQSEFGLLRSDPYLRQLMLLGFISTVAVTGLDFVFKAMVHQQLPSAELGHFFSRYYAALNGLALIVQLAIGPWLVRVAGVSRALLAMPLLILATSLGFVFSGGLLMVLLLKGSDGVLRHSVNRTATEILYVPLTRRVRDAFKGFAEAVGQRGGQAFASILILGAIAAGATLQTLGWALVVLAGIWLVCIFGVQSHYLDLFRSYLQQGTIETRGEIPDLDLGTLETLLGSLSSENDAEVTAALDMFAAYDRVKLIPALILYHPSRAVVLRAFSCFNDTRRADLVAITGRLVGHPDHEIRANAIRLHTKLRPDATALRRYLRDPSPSVRITALVGLIAAGSLRVDEGQTALREAIENGSSEARQELASSLHLLPAEEFAWVAAALLRDAEPELSAALARSLAVTPSVAHIDVLIRLLAVRDARADARLALVRIGEPALRQLERSLGDAELSRSLRRHLPRTISKFANPRAADVLLERLMQEGDEAVAFKILRGLGWHRHHFPSHTLDEGLLNELTARTLTRAIDLLFYRLVAGSAAALEERWTESGGELLLALLEDCETRALERLFRLLHVSSPEEAFEVIFAGLRSSDSKVRAGSLELLSHVVPDEFRAGIIALVDDISDKERLAAAATYYEPAGRATYVAALARLAEAPDDTVAVGEVLTLHRQNVLAMRAEVNRPLASLASYHAIALRIQAPPTRSTVAANPDHLIGEVTATLEELELGRA